MESVKQSKNYDEEIRRVIGQNLKALRESRNLTREQLAKFIGNSPFTIRNTEHGETSPKIPSLVKYADFYGVSLDEIFGRGNYLDKINAEYRVQVAMRILSQFAKVTLMQSDLILIEQSTPNFDIVDSPRKTLSFSPSQLVNFVDEIILQACNSRKTFGEILDDRIKEIFSEH